MPRDTPLDPPPADRVVDAAAAALERPVDGAVPFVEGLNAVYRIDHPGGDRSVLKAATFSTDAELLAEAALLARLGRETPVPFPRVLVTHRAGETSLGVAVALTEYREGRTVTDLLSLPPDARDRLVVESGRHLAAVHDCRVSEGFGRLRIAGEGGGDRPADPRPGSDPGDCRFEADPGTDSWREWFRALVGDALDGLTGSGYTTDDDPRFADLAPGIGSALDGLAGTLPRSVPPSVAFEDYRPANLVLGPDDADPLVAGVLDVGDGPTADGLLDLALAEDALVDVPLGGTDEADRLRRSLRDAYLSARSDLDEPAFGGDRYAGYRLYARTRHLAAFGYWWTFAREDDPDAVARRWRSFVRERLAELG